MLIAVRLQEDRTLELEPTSSYDREYIKQMNTVNGSCIAYIDTEPDVTMFINELSLTEDTKLSNLHYIVQDWDIPKFIELVLESNKE
jgi:hypothetical protein